MKFKNYPTKSWSSCTVLWSFFYLSSLYVQKRDCFFNLVDFMTFIIPEISCATEYVLNCSLFVIVIEHIRCLNSIKKWNLFCRSKALHWCCVYKIYYLIYRCNLYKSMCYLTRAFPNILYSNNFWFLFKNVRKKFKVSLKSYNKRFIKQISLISSK